MNLPMNPPRNFPQQQNDLQITMLKTLAASASFVAEGLAVMAFSPLNFLSKNLQAQPELKRCGYVEEIEPYGGYVDCATRMIQAGGWKVLFTGAPLAWAMHLSEIGAKTVTSELIMSLPLNEAMATALCLGTPFAVAVNPVLSGIVVAATYPLSLSFTRQVTHTWPLKNDLSGLRACAAVTEKVGYNTAKHFLLVSVLGTMAAATFLKTATSVCDLLNIEIASEQSWGQTMMFFGGYTVAYPFTTVGTRLMVAGGSDKEYSSFYDCAKSMYKEEGISSFFSGAFPIIFGVGLSAAFLIGEKTHVL